MRKKITTLLAIVLLSTQVTPAFAQYGVDDMEQLRMCGEQVCQYVDKAVRFVARHRDDIFGSPFLTSPLHYTIWKIQRNGEKAKMERQRNKKTIVNTQSYEERSANGAQKKPAPTQKQNPPKKQAPAKKSAPAKKK